MWQTTCFDLVCMQAKMKHLEGLAKKVLNIKSSTTCAMKAKCRLEGSRWPVA